MHSDRSVQFDPQRARFEPTDCTDGRRAAGRARVEDVVSSIGMVVDLSVIGMRVESPELPDADALDVVVQWGDSLRVAVRGEIVWRRRIGWKKRQAGVRFVDVSPELRGRLVAMISAARCRRTM